METKEQLLSAVKEWVVIDNKLREHQRLVKECKAKQKNMSVKLMETMKSNEIECFDLKNGSLVYKKNKIKKPLNKQTLFGLLDTYFKGEKETVDQLGKYIMDNRQEVIKETIHRKIDKEK
jgi:hypothetical protein